MKLISLELKGFRGIANQIIDLKPGSLLSGGLHPIVFIGSNGSGKSSVLDAIAMLLSWMTTRLIKPNGQGRSLQQSDIRSPDASQAFLRLALAPDLGSDLEIAWQLAYTQAGLNPKSARKYDQLNDWLKGHRDLYEQDPNLALPSLVYYPSHRQFKATQQISSLKKEGFKRLDIYKDAFPEQLVDFESLFQWLNYQAAVEDNQRLNTNLDHRDPQLSVVRKACSRFLEDYGTLHIHRTATNTAVVVQKHGVTLDIKMLSDGEKNLLTLAGDLARRLAIANPGLDDPLQGEGIVLIDEIELHLHPQWQSSIIEKLCTTFPRCQFILTTHSPQVITNLDWVYLLDASPQGTICQLVRTYGKDSNRILETIMGTPERSPAMKAKFDRLFRLIDEGKLSEAHRFRLKLRDELQEDAPELVRAEWIIKRREVLGR